MVVCLEEGLNLHMAQLMPLPLTVSCFSKIQIGFTFLVPAHVGSPDKGPLNGCECAGEIIFKIGEQLAELQAEWLIVSYAPFALDCSSLPNAL